MGGGGHQREDKVVTVFLLFFMSLSGKAMQQECFGSNFFLLFY